MPLDTSIPLSVKPIEVPNQLALMGNVMQLQGGLTQNELARYQLASAQRNDLAQQALGEAYKNALDPTTGQIDTQKLYGALANSGAARLIPDVQKQMLATQVAQAGLHKTNVEAAQGEFNLQQNKYQKALIDVAGFTTPEDVAAHMAPHIKAGDITQEQASAVLRTLPPDASGMAAWRQSTIAKMLTPQQAMGYTTPDANAVLGSQTTQRGQNMTARTAAAGQAQTGAELAWKGVPVPGVAGVPGTGAPGAGPAGPAGAGQPGQAPIGANIPLQEQQKREAAYPKTNQALNATTQSIDNLESDIKTLIKHPGLGGISGLIAGHTPNLSPSARDAQALLDKIMSSGQLNVMTALKNASSTGATGFGQLSEKEGEVLRNSLAAVQQGQATPDMIKGLKKWLIDLDQTKANMQQGFNDEYAYRNQGTKGAAATHPSFPGFSIAQ